MLVDQEVDGSERENELVAEHSCSTFSRGFHWHVKGSWTGRREEWGVG